MRDNSTNLFACWIICAFLLPGCTHRSRINLQRVVVPKDPPPPIMQTLSEPPPINVWIHGTLFVKKPFFYDTLRLHKMVDLNNDFYIHGICTLLHERDPISFPQDTMYAFGWCGNLNAYERLRAAKNLYNQLQELVDDYIQQWRQYPVIRIITHSHGGNVALYLAFVEQAKQQNLLIDTLLMLACPVQMNTMHFAQSPVFKNVYSLYSSLDMVQVIAPQRFNEKLPFSSREFPQHNNMTQARVRINGHAVLHTEFTSRNFISSIPLILKQLTGIKDKQNSDDKKHLFHVITSKTLYYKKAMRQIRLQQAQVADNIASA